jgi:hypothetical protein
VEEVVVDITLVVEEQAALAVVVLVVITAWLAHQEPLIRVVEVAVLEEVP